MSTVYSLICFGGLSGKTVTMTAANPCVVTLASNGLRTGFAIVFSTTGKLYDGLVAGTTYYAYSSGVGVSTFNLYDTYANAIAGGSTGRIITSGTQSGTHTVKSAYRNGLTTDQKARYGTPGNERIYNGIVQALSSLGTLLTTTPDPNGAYAIESSDAFDDFQSFNASFTLPCGSLILTTMINGVRGPAWHNWDYLSGYAIKNLANSQGAMLINAYYATVDGVVFYGGANNATIFGSASLACFITVKNNIVFGNPAATGQKGLAMPNPGDVYNNLVLLVGGNGIEIPQYGGLGVKHYNNLVTKCTGFGVQGNAGGNQGLAYNNISVKNGTNWGGMPNYTAMRASHNYGEPQDKKTITTDYTTNVNRIAMTGHGRTAGQVIQFTTTGTLPTVVATGLPLVPGKSYYVLTVVDVNTFTISASYNGTVLAFSNNGTGTHYCTQIWTTDASEMYIDMTNPESVFTAWTNYPYDFRSASASAPQVDSGMTVYLGDPIDGNNKVRPNYNLGVTENWDGGPFEFDHGHGLTPVNCNFILSGIPSGSEIRLYDRATETSGFMGTELAGGVESWTGGNYTYTYIYTGTTKNITVQVLGAGFEENITYYTLGNSNQTIPIILKKEENV